VQTQRDAIRQVVRAANDHGAPLVLGGDIFNTPRVSSEVLNMALAELTEVEQEVFVLAGNHDLPYHDYGNVGMCNFGTLRYVFPELSEHAHRFNGVAFQFGQEKETDTPVVFTHQLVFEDENARPFEGVGKTAEELLAEFPKALWIFCGDYHHAFVHEQTQTNRKTGETRVRRVVNPGCLLRQVADMKDYQCQVYLVEMDLDTMEIGSVTPIMIHDEAELVTDEYLRKEEEREDRIGSFLEVVKSAGVASLSFRDNLERKLGLAAIRPGVRRAVQHILEVVNNERT